MHQQTKPFIIERRPTRKPKPDAQKPSIWGRLNADIAQGLKDEREEDHAVATGGDNRDSVSGRSLHIRFRLQGMQETHRTLRMGRRLEDRPLVVGEHR